jgi:hypothetical protein
MYRFIVFSFISLATLAVTSLANISYNHLHQKQIANAAERMVPTDPKVSAPKANSWLLLLPVLLIPIAVIAFRSKDDMEDDIWPYNEVMGAKGGKANREDFDVS